LHRKPTMKILITGSSGIIGTVIRHELPDYEYVKFDLPGSDARNYQSLAEAMKGCDLAIHLAWDTVTENWRSGTINPDNILMVFNFYAAALAAGVPKVILASSVHAYDDSLWKGPGLLSPNLLPSPDGPYGASKVFLESLGRYYAKLGLEVICIRFMGMAADGRPVTDDPMGKRKWFSHRDCGSLIRAIASAPLSPGRHTLMYGVSNNDGRIHDFINPFGWVPRDNAAAGESKP